MSADVIQFIPRPRHNRDTDFPTIAFIVPEQRVLILGEPHERAVYESGLGPDLGKDPA